MRGLTSSGMCLDSIGIGREQLRFGLPQLEADPLNKRTAQWDLTSGDTAEIPLGIARNLRQPIPGIFIE